MHFGGDFSTAQNNDVNNVGAVLSVTSMRAVMGNG